LNLFKRTKDSVSKVKAFYPLNHYDSLVDGYTENPLAHHSGATETEIESEYFMQYVYPEKLHRIALRTPVGYRLTYGYSGDLWNNDLGIIIPEDEKKSKIINRKLRPYLRSRNWFREMEKVTAFEKEQGESILLCYYDDQADLEQMRTAVTMNDEILRVEAFNKLDYWIEGFDEYGEPTFYWINLKGPFGYRDIITTKIHSSRVIRKVTENIEWRFTGYADISPVYDSIVILSTILKATGEAAFRWGTGHPVIFTKDIITKADYNKLVDEIGDYNRKSWHMLPSEYVDRVETIGQAGAMLNFKALADICIEQVLIGTGFPKPILLGEVAGVMGSEVSERSYFALMDTDHTELEPFVLEYFKRDKNVRKLLYGVAFFELDWGVREVMDKTSQVEYRQKEIANTLALTDICTIDECRELLGFKPLGSDDYGDIVLGVSQFYMAELELEMRQLEMEAQMATAANVPTTGGETQTTTSYKQNNAETKKSKTSTQKDLEKNKKIGPKMSDAISPEELKEKERELRLMDNYNKMEQIMKKMMNDESTNKICSKLEIYPKTWNKIYNVLGLNVDESGG